MWPTEVDRPCSVNVSPPLRPRSGFHHAEMLQPADDLGQVRVRRTDRGGDVPNGQALSRLLASVRGCGSPRVAPAANGKPVDLLRGGCNA